MKEATVTKKVVKQYTFTMSKNENGSNKIGHTNFDFPDNDGLAVVQLLHCLHECDKITVIVEKEESV